MRVKARPRLWDDLNIGGCMYWDYDVGFFADALSIVDPKNILETGFFGGSSAFFWLYLTQPDVKLTSVDPMENLYNPNEKHTGRLENVEKLQKQFPNRFTFLKKDSKLVRPDLQGQKFDLFFIDGDHWEAGIRNDFQLAVDLEIPWIMVDDFCTTVESVYNRDFSNKYFLVRMYGRRDTFMGKRIPIHLMRRVNSHINNLTFIS